MIKKIIKKIESGLSASIKTVIGVFVAAVFLYATTITLTHENDAIQNSAMILNYAGNSGGSGVIISSNKRSSKVLTNAHVCGVVENGGLIQANSGYNQVAYYQKSETHDLCLITVFGDLGTETTIAPRKPVNRYEKAVVAGHPNLLPIVVTDGHFSSRQIIEVFIGFRECTKKEYQNDPLLCGFYGGFPILKKYETTLVTATIMPGSSGSGVYNGDMELSGLVFAGQQNLGYAWTVPYEFLTYFLEEEILTLIKIKPEQGKKNNGAALLKNARLKCKKAKNEKMNIQKICNIIGATTLFVR